MNELNKNRFVMDNETGMTYRLLTDTPTFDGTNRRWCKTSLTKNNYGSKKCGRCQVAESKLIPISELEGLISWEAEKIIRGKQVRSVQDRVILSLHKSLLESKGFKRGIVESHFRGGDK